MFVIGWIGLIKSALSLELFAIDYSRYSDSLLPAIQGCLKSFAFVRFLCIVSLDRKVSIHEKLPWKTSDRMRDVHWAHFLPSES